MRISMALVGWLIGLTLSAGLQAQSADPFEGEVAVATQSEADRVAALPAALAAVFVQRTGDQAAATDPQLTPALTEATTWLQQYRYRQSVANVDGVSDTRTVLIARFDAGAVDRALSSAGRMLWPEPRPQPVVWLAIDDGRGPRLLGSAQAQAVTALTSRARQRGLRLTYPLLDLEDQQFIDAARVWAMDSQSAAQATQRYQSNTVLMGRLFREGSGWAAEWQVLQDGEVLTQKRVTDADSATPLAAGADLAASALAARYAADLASAGSPGSFSVRVAGVGSAEDYARLMGQLKRMPTVRDVTLIGTEGDALTMTLELATGMQGFERSASGIGLLQRDERAESGRDIALDPSGDDEQSRAQEVQRFRLL